MASIELPQRLGSVTVPPSSVLPIRPLCKEPSRRETSLLPGATIHSDEIEQHLDSSMCTNANVLPLTLTSRETKDSAKVPADLFARTQHDEMKSLSSLDQDDIGHSATLSLPYGARQTESHGSLTTESRESLGSLDSSDNEKPMAGLDVQHGTMEDDDMETICPDSESQVRASKLSEWANFLHDVDFDACISSSSTDKKDRFV
jgi:hypothetical protein